MTMHRITLTHNANGEPLMSADALALLVGIDAQTINDHMMTNTTGDAAVFPTAWLQAAHRRRSEASAVTGSDHLRDVLTYWAKRDLGADIEFTAAAARPEPQNDATPTGGDNSTRIDLAQLIPEATRLMYEVAITAGDGHATDEVLARWCAAHGREHFANLTAIALSLTARSIIAPTLKTAAELGVDLRILSRWAWKDALRDLESDHDNDHPERPDTRAGQ